jgi:hypothetical protein
MNEPILSYFYRGKHYHSKFACCEAAMLDGIHITDLTNHIRPIMYKNPFYFSSYDWTKEPQQDWYEMCVERAHEIRQQHKYLALAFSGGSDSAFVLDIFLKNNIPLDEIYTVLGNPFKDKNIDAGYWEVYNHAIPYMKYIQKKYDLKNTKFIVHDNYEDVFVGHFNIDLLRKAHHGIFYTPTGNCHYVIIQNYKAQDKFIINGAFEANVKYDGKYYMEMWDTDNVAQVCHRNYIPFFFPKDKPEMHAKQCHLLMKYFKKHGIKSRDVQQSEYHSAQISATRKWLYDYTESPYFKKNIENKTDKWVDDRRNRLFDFTKTKAFLGASVKRGWFDYKKVIDEFWLQPTINNTHLYNLPWGLQVSKKYLES